MAALVHDEALLEQPALLGAVTASTRFALESNRLQAELSLADERVADARSSGRRELERDLHDGAQQRLIALRMKVSVLSRPLHTDVHQAGELAAELGPDIDATLQEVRDLGHGRGPRLLVKSGLGVALASAVRNGPMPATFTGSGLGRYPDEVETAVYFTCLEALQNAESTPVPERRWRSGPWTTGGASPSWSRTPAALRRRRRPGRAWGWATCASG